MIKKIEFGVEFMAPPFFNPSSEEVGHLDFDEIPITEKLKQEIKEWDEVYQNTYNDEYPPDSCFKSKKQKQWFYKRGRELFEKLKQELPNVKVYYYDMEYGNVVE
ncbi:MAG: Unknown protein [uncultured Campylobacterales bacterium]|uniref:Uncharacterized protein n=1 Tax=uncultured Campylobacterales bacterium TaxID=352960 RepID=A0A6S6SUE6_9BACT|nr:MAG: Unknown protein [uncultured Campylobacterales bacterium]